MDTNFIVYQAYGHSAILQEALLSIASATRFRTGASEFRIVVYTDSVSYLKSFLPDFVHFVEMPTAVWEEWKGPKRFVHRAKIQMLAHFIAHHQGNVLYCDTDTYFTQSPQALFDSIASGNLLMHMDEGRLQGSENAVFRKLERFLQKYEGESIPSSTHMWNAGVLGFPTSEAALLKEVSQLSDKLYDAYPKHVMEQLAFSFYFQQRELRACEGSIFHYWDFKEYREVLGRFFESQKGKPFTEWSRQLAAILPMELIKKKRAFMAKPSWVRKWMTWTGQVPVYA